MTDDDRARAFHALHVKGAPLVLYNIWDAGSARAVAAAGAKAVATGSWSVAAAHGYGDGEEIPLDLLATIAARIAATVDLPLTVDLEGGYAVEPEGVAASAARIVAARAVGVNFEDRVVKGTGLHAVAAQAARIAAMRAVAPHLFINARTDLFLAEPDRSRHSALVPQAIDRAAAYATAGASGFFVPGLIDPALIARVCAAVTLPVNAMMMAGAPSIAELAQAGVGRISFGPGPYRAAMAALTERCRAETG